MKIVQLITRLDVIGGAQNHVISLSKRLADDGHEVIVVTGDYVEELWNLERENIKVIVIPTLQREIDVIKDIRSVIVLRKILKSISPQLIAIHSTKAGTIGRIAAYSLKIKSIFTAHGWSFTEGVSPRKKIIFKHTEKLLSRVSTRVIAVSEYDRLLAIQQKVIQQEKIVTIQNGVDENEQSVNRNNDNERTHIVMVARFEVPKRQDLLMEVLSQLKQLDWTVSFVGEGKQRKIVEEKVRKDQLESRVSFFSSTTNVESLLNKADLFVLLSDFEGLPLSIIEAMRAGLPIIASDVGGVSELVAHGENGLLVNHRNQNEVRESLEMLMMNKRLLNNMGQHSYQRFLNNFTFEEMYEKTVEQYLFVCQN